jgi:hypothetical protein
LRRQRRRPRRKSNGLRRRKSHRQCDRPKRRAHGPVRRKGAASRIAARVALKAAVRAGAKSGPELVIAAARVLARRRSLKGLLAEPRLGIANNTRADAVSASPPASAGATSVRARARCWPG